MFSPANSDQHTSTLEEEDPNIQNIPRVIDNVKRNVAQVQEKLDKLNSLRNEFALPRITDLEAEKNRIRQYDLTQARQSAIFFFEQFNETEKRCRGLQMAESICREQMLLLQKIADESLHALRQFSDVERRRISMINTANERIHTLNRDANRYRGQCEQSELINAQLREQANESNQKVLSLTQEVVKLQAEGNALSAEKGQWAREKEAYNTWIEERDKLVEDLRKREVHLNTELGENQLLIEKLRKEKREIINIMEQKENDLKRLAKTEKKQALSALKAQCADELKKCEEICSKSCERYIQALNEAALETQRLDSERRQYYNNWKKLEKEMEDYKRGVMTKLRREMLNNFAQNINKLKSASEGDKDGVVPPPHTLQPVENIAQRFLNQMAYQQESNSQESDSNLS